jgi:hypothetical protein
MTIFANLLLNYSRIEYVNTTDDYNVLQNNERLLVFVFTKTSSGYYNNIYHSIRVCNVVKNGPTMFYDKYGYKRVNIDTIYYMNGRFEYIDESTSSNESFSENLQKYISKNIVYFTVRIPNSLLLEDIREHNFVSSLKLLSIVSICTIDLPKYNKINRNCILSLRSGGTYGPPIIVNN